jgi:hypothetical protein
MGQIAALLLAEKSLSVLQVTGAIGCHLSIWRVGFCILLGVSETWFSGAFAGYEDF